MADIKVCYAFLEPSAPVAFTPSQVRGYMGYLFINDAEFHHHMDNPYHYPLIQYKKINGKPMIMGLSAYADVLLRKISQVDRILVGGCPVEVRSVEVKNEVVSVTKERKNYRFISPWIALNERNHKLYMSADEGDRIAMLKKILVGNVLSMLKGLGIFLDYRIEVSMDHVRPLWTRAHGNAFIAFKPSFTVNIGIPRYAGLGKSVSKGFGTVDQVDS